MFDENNIENVAPAPSRTQTNSARCNLEHALYSKIARLPEGIRDELNQRLLNGHRGPELLAWLNQLPAVKEILAAHFDGAEINAPNLTHWRQTGYHRWLRHKHTKDFRQYVADFTREADGKFAPAAAAIAAGKIFEFLDTADPAQTNPNDLVKYAIAAAQLAKTEQGNARIGIANERLRQAELHLLLKRDKMQRDDVATRLHVLNDARAKEIASSSESEAAKIELLGIHTYGDDWEQRPVPDPDDSNRVPNPDSGGNQTPAKVN